jgi:hypothetical protein
MELREIENLKQFFVKVGNAVNFHINNLLNSDCRLSYCQSIFLFCAFMCNIWILSLNKHYVRVWTKSIWPRIGHLQTRSVTWGLLKSQKILISWATINLKIRSVLVYTACLSVCLFVRKSNQKDKPKLLGYSIWLYWLRLIYSTNLHVEDWECRACGREKISSESFKKRDYFEDVGIE